MPDPAHRLPQNAPGPYYVDDTCTDCDLCRSIALATFDRHDDTGLSYVHRQPATPEERALAEESRLSCPTETNRRPGLTADRRCRSDRPGGIAPVSAPTPPDIQHPTSNIEHPMGDSDVRQVDWMLSVGC